MHPTNPYRVPKRHSRSRRPPTARDIAADYSDFGGGVNPLAYMGYTFGKPYSAPPRACSAPPSRTITSKPFPYQHQYPSVSKPRHDLSAPVIPTSSTVDHHPSGHNHPSPICLPLVGPVFPLLPPLSLMDVGCSSILSHSLYLVWRIFLLFFTLLLFIFIVLCNPSHLRFLPGVAVLLSVLSAVLMFHRCMSYRFNSNNHLALTERRASFSCDTLVFQAAIHMCLIAALVLSLSTIHTSAKPLLISTSNVNSTTMYIFFALILLHILDIYITPLPFHLFNILPASIFATFVAAIALRNSVALSRVIILLLIFVGSIIVGFLLHLFARALLLMHHKRLPSYDDSSTDKLQHDLKPAKV